MISAIQFENLKCFGKLEIELSNLTLLSGFNAGGKSTVIQSLLVLSQTLRSARSGTLLSLNGDVALLGSATDVLNNREGAKSLRLGLVSSTDQIDWRFVLDEDNRRSLRLERIVWNGEQLTPGGLPPVKEGVVRDWTNGIEPRYQTNTLSELIWGVKNLVFLSAARLAQMDTYPMPEEAVDGAVNLGSLGQYAAYWLYERGDSQVAPQLRHPDHLNAATLRLQLNAWISDLFPGTEVNAIPIPKTNQMRLEFRTGVTNDWTSPANVGYGISYAFPILVAGLLGDKRYPIIVDSPEAHLHPLGQSRMGAFLAQVADHGSQLLVETHSDHLLNGVRLAVQRGHLAENLLAIYFFAPGGESHVTRLSIDASGNIDNWPPGFFDQSEKDMAALAGWI